MNEINWPALVGMQRSASRMTWQILTFLLPNERPSTWYSHIPWLDDDWPVRRHSYLGDTIPVIYTYRHPVEAYLSYYSRNLQDVGREVEKTAKPDPITGLIKKSGEYFIQTEEQAAKGAMVAIGNQLPLYMQLKEDQTAGRDVLFLRYEDYYRSPEARIYAIANFIGIELTDQKVEEILKYTSVQKNAKRGKAIADYIPASIFSSGFNNKTGMQKGHVNLETMGRPGAHIEANPEFVASVVSGQQPALKALSEMCTHFGYEPWRND